eukprot:1152101_1
MVGFIKRLNVQFCRLKTVFFTRGIHFGAHYGTHLPKRRNETKLYGESQMIFLISNFDIIWICPFAFYAILLYSSRSISIYRFLNQRFKQIQIYFKTSTAINNLSSIVFYKMQSITCFCFVFSFLAAWCHYANWKLSLFVLLFVFVGYCLNVGAVWILQHTIECD